MFGRRDRPVMVVEDDEDLREVIGALLEAEGYPVVYANDGSDALTLLADGSRPFVILLDWIMPNLGGDAFRRCQLEIPSLAGIPVVVLSGVPPEMVSTGAGAVWVLRKPPDVDALLDLVARYHAASLVAR